MWWVILGESRFKSNQIKINIIWLSLDLSHVCRQPFSKISGKAGYDFRRISLVCLLQDELNYLPQKKSVSDVFQRNDITRHKAASLWSVKLASHWIVWLSGFSNSSLNLI